MLDPNTPWLSQGYKNFERENFYRNDVRNRSRPSSTHSTRQQTRRVKSATHRRVTTPVNFQPSNRPKSARPPSTQIYRHEKVDCYNYRVDSQSSTRTPLRHRRTQSARFATQSSDQENIQNSPLYKKYYEELESLASMENGSCLYCPVDCRPPSSSSFRPTSSTGLLATLLPSHFERYVFWTRPQTAPPTRREYFQLPRHNNIRRGKVPHYTNFVSSISLADRDSTPSPPPHPRRAFEDAHHGRRELRRCVHRRKQPVEQMVKRKNEEFISVEDERDNDTEEELLKLVEDDVIIHDLTPDLIESEADQKTEPYAPTPTPLASPPLSPPPPPIEESQLEREPTPQPQTTTLPPSPPKEQQEPQPEEELQDELPIPEVTSLPAPEVILPTASISQERLDEPSSIEPVLEEDSIPPVTKKEVTFQQPFVQEHHFEDLETKEETTDVAESEVATEENGEEEANKDMEDKTEDDATQIETANSYDNQNPDDVVSNTNTSSANQTNSEEDDTKKRRPLGPAPKYKVDIFGMDAQDLLDIEMRLRRRGAEPSPDSPDITDISDIDVKKPKMQTWLRGRLALSRQSSRFEIPMDVRVLESMTPMDYLLGYCRINKRRQAMYKKAFRKVDKDNDGVISLKEMEKGLNEIFVDSIEPEQVETLLDLLKIEQSVKLRSKMFCAISALTERLLFQQLTTEEAAELLNHKKERIEDADFSALDWKLEGCKIQPELRRLLYQL
ncbi:uncharacterized protein [Antedon mediterranea]|uniref:uncharacterized protein isoform X2 n=1 Tax=Antedon mediterranea TaxID=105859 RepID=UPI003AF79AEE